MNYFVEAKEAVEPIMDLSLQHGDKTKSAQIYATLGAYYYMVEEDFATAFEYLHKALKISEEIGNALSVFFANFWLGLGVSLTGDFQRAHGHLKKALHINREANSLWGESIALSAISHFVFYFEGNIKLSYQTSDEAVKIAEESGDIYSKAAAYSYHGISCYSKGKLKRATKYLSKGIDYCERIQFLSVNALAELCLARTYLATGEYEKSKEHHDKTILLIEKGRFMPSWKFLALMSRARLKAIYHTESINKEILYGYYSRNRVDIHEGWLARYLAEILLKSGDHDLAEAEEWIEKAIKVDKKYAMKFCLAKDYAFYAELHKQKGDRTKAEDNLNKAIGIFKECGADGWVEKFEKDLTAL
jgi:tetratricopeptide (TPR) repeat protein